MLTRLVRYQLIIFAVASVIGVTTMLFDYIQVPTLLGLNRYVIKLELPDDGGLYRFSNVTYRGVQIGKVTSVRPTSAGAEAFLSLNTFPRVPTDVEAQIRSVSAVGEQYVELEPRSDSSDFLKDGSIISAHSVVLPQKTGPMLDRINDLAGSIPKDQVGRLLDESFNALNGAGYDFGSLLDSASTISRDARATAEHATTLVNDGAPFLDSQRQSAAEIRTWSHNLADATDQLAQDDTQIRTILKAGPASLQEVSRLLDQLRPTLPVLLANLVTIGQIGVTYNPSLEQLLLLLPPFVSSFASFSVTNTPTGLGTGGFTVSAADPPACTVGFLPPSMWRSPDDLSAADTPDNLYCKLPQDSPIAVRGARNYPCMGHAGKRAPTVEICDSDQPFEPLAVRQHVLGPYPLDPNLLSQGVPPDSRVTPGDQIFDPTAGTPPPAPDSPIPTAAPLPPPDGVPPPPPADTSNPRAAPSAATTRRSAAPPAVAIVGYDPLTGRYVGPDLKVRTQSDLVNPGRKRIWTDLLPR